MKIHVGRKFIAFVLCLLVVTILGIFGRGTESFPAIIALYTAYTTGNVVQKATKKEDFK